MNRLTADRRAAVVAALVEGNSLRGTAGLTGVARMTVEKLLRDLGAACAAYHDTHVRNLKSQRIQCDEIWSFVGSKAKNVPEHKRGEWGDVWTWTAIDADSKLIVSYRVGQRTAADAYDFMQDVASRLTSRIQLTTDQHKVYLNAVDYAFGVDVDYTMLEKHYGSFVTNGSAAHRYTPAKITAAKRVTITGDPNPRHISTSYVERQNLTMRMHMKRFARLSNGFSEKIEMHAHNVALHFAYYNFCKIHQTLHVTPAMEAGLSDHAWELSELVALLESEAGQERTA